MGKFGKSENIKTSRAWQPNKNGKQMRKCQNGK
jgi:hypothetical protein